MNFSTPANQKYLSTTIYNSINLSFNTVHKISFEHYLYLPSF